MISFKDPLLLLVNREEKPVLELTMKQANVHCYFFFAILFLNNLTIKLN